MNTINEFTETIYKFNEYNSSNVLIIGIGSGSDIIGAYALGKFLKENNPNATINIAVAVTPKSDYEGFDNLQENLYQVNSDKVSDLSKLHHTLQLIKQIYDSDNSFSPYVLVRPKYIQDTDIQIHQKDVTDAISKSLIFLNPDYIIATDNGGDSLTGGVSDNVEKEFDRTGIRALQKFGKSFDYIVFGPGCDGESTKEMIKSSIELEKDSFKGAFSITELAKLWSSISENFLPKDRTPNIILSALNLSNQEIEIPRHRKPLIPADWLKIGIAFDGLNFKGNNQ
ncbi:MAG: DUF1152 domain-containing protein [Flavobacteriales bacterium]|nr:DUF1152 domain-containing protein [Flavobacteriales bacterium]